MANYRIFTSVGKLELNIAEHLAPDSSGERYLVCPICTPIRQPKNQAQKKLAANVQEMKWRCNHCQEGGLLHTEKDLPDKVKPLMYSPSFKNMTEDIPLWFKNRGISIDTINHFKIKKAYKNIMQNNNSNEEMRGKFQMRTCIAFPLINDGKLINIQYRDQDKNFSMEKGAEKILFNIDAIKKRDTKKCIITEGYIDCMSYHEAGLHYVVSVPNGVSISNKEAEVFASTGKMIVEKALNLTYLDHHIDLFAKFEEVIIATDDDPAGIKLREELARRIGKHKCRFTVFSRWKKLNGQPCKDGNDVLIHCGQKELIKTIEEADYFPIQSITTIDQVWDEMVSDFNQPAVMGLPLGFKELANHFSVHAGHTLAINGYPGMGKTSWMLYLLVLMAVKYGWKSACYTPENYPLKLVYDHLIEIYIGKSSKKTSSNRMSMMQYQEGKKFVEKNIFLINDDSGSGYDEGYNVNSLFKEMQNAINRYGVKICCFDPWNSLEHKRESQYNIDDYIKSKLSKINRFSSRNEVFTIIGIHPPTPEKSASKIYNAPSMFDMEGGGAWSKKMYEIMCVHKTTDEIHDTSVEVHVQKIKFQKTTGFPTPRALPAKLIFNRSSNRFEDPDGYDPLYEALNDKLEQLELTF
jgi:twinkle protein